MIHGITKIKGDLRLKTMGGVVRFVGANCTYTTIQGAMNACSAGDTIMVAPGTYTEAITFTQDNITIKALGSYLDTTITQTAANVVEFSTKHGCTIEDFTLSITAANSVNDFVVTSSNDAVTGAGVNILRNCKITWSGSTALNGVYADIYIADGDFELRNCDLVFTNTYSGTDPCNMIGISTPANHTLNMYNCNVTLTNSATGDGDYTWALYGGGANNNINAWNCKFIVTTAYTTTSTTVCATEPQSGVWNFYNCDFNATCSSTGLTYCIWNDASGVGGIENCYNCIFKSTNTDNDGKVWQRTSSGSLNMYGGISKDGSIDTTNLGNYGFLVEGDTGYKAVSTKTTGGSGSAGVGKQYVEIKINGTTYKALYET